MREPWKNNRKENAASEEDEDEFEGDHHGENSTHDAQHQQESRLLGVRPQREMVHLLREGESEIGSKKDQRGARECVFHLVDGCVNEFDERRRDLLGLRRTKKSHIIAAVERRFVCLDRLRDEMLLSQDEGCDEQKDYAHQKVEMQVVERE